MMTTKTYAAYGSNMNLIQMATRCPGAELIGTGTLEDYKLTFRGKYKGVANIEPCKGKSVPIVLWKITEDCEVALDQYEGYPRLYEKKEIKVKVKDKLKKAMVYVMTEDYTHMPSKPTDYYYGVIAQGYADNEIDIHPLEEALNECIREVEQLNG